MRAGVLALQGDFAAHARALAASGPIAGARLDPVTLVRTAEAVDGLDLLVLPGGESTTLLKLLAGTGIEGAIRALLARGGVVFGTCAGAILLAARVTNPAQASFGLLDVDIERNAYGRQVDSFEAVLEPDYLAMFIRAPRIRRTGPGVEVLARWQGEPVLVREGRVFAATFHPEMTADRRVHRLVLDAVASRGSVPARR